MRAEVNMVSELTIDERDRLVKRDEDSFFDRKSRRIQPAKLSKTLSAFANTDGGELVVGIEDDGSWDGFASIEEANDLHNTVATVLAPGYYGIEYLKSPGDSGIVVLILIRRSPGVCSTAAGEVYVRRGAASVRIKDGELEALRRAKGVVSFENQGLVFPVFEISNAEKCLEFCLTIIPVVEPEIFLRKQNLVNSEGNPTVAGTLLYHEEPQVHLPKAGVKIYRYKTDSLPERRYLDGTPETIDGPLYDQIAAAVRRTTEIVDSIPIMTGGGMRQIQYPPETLHEILTNAVLHRDYWINDDVHVRIFDNRIEVESPGRLPAHVTPRNILDERFARNPSIVRLINRFPNPPNMDVGEGLNTAFKAMEALRLQPPEIRETSDRVVVTVRHESLASPQKAIMDYVKKEGSINNPEARKVTGIDQERTIRRLFESLVSANELVRKGLGRGTRYFLPE
ncbi:ATP-dependent DNA helicase RecG [Crossiella equi]|uniref:ATP-dependent DNA helicase RecG n=1 Tax=Crossiella equi TaxID=130796 RepID=A0ABS5ABP7_9PSEU|nr:ATP-binding protein [Crossiella equi]MBP2474001.1 ATP-dependent DNA helicase RecG [Crossiella equi]